MKVRYKKIEPELLSIYHVADRCGFFTTETDLNGGYGCTFPEKEKGYPGCCYQFDCPVSHEASLEDLRKMDQDLYEEYKHCTGDLEDHGSEWMVMYRTAKTTKES